MTTAMMPLGLFDSTTDGPRTPAWGLLWWLQAMSTSAAVTGTAAWTEGADTMEAYGVVAPPPSPGVAIAEIRRVSGLTWEHLATLLGVERRTLHFWASGRPMSQKNEERLWRVRDAIRRLDTGNTPANRAALLAVTDGVSLLQRFAAGDFAAVEGRKPHVRPVAPQPSAEVRVARRPPPPAELVDALQPAGESSGPLLGSAPIVTTRKA